MAGAYSTGCSTRTSDGARKMKWKEIAIETTTQGTDAMAEVLISAGANGVWIEDASDAERYRGDNGDWDYVDEDLLAQDGACVLVKGYLPEALWNNIRAICDKVAFVVSAAGEGVDFGSGTVRVHTLEDKDWAREWMRYFKPIPVGQRLIIGPSWEAFDARGRIPVRIEPGSAFGTGQHESTRLCLELGENLVRTGDAVLDVGCGTGVLGIAAVLLGAKRALLVDKDEAALAAARDNARLNEVEKSIRVQQSDLLQGVSGAYQLVFVNIVADAVVRMLPCVSRVLAPGGAVIAGGIIRQREADVLAAAQRCGLDAAHSAHSGEWASVLLRGRQ